MTHGASGSQVRCGDRGRGRRRACAPRWSLSHAGLKVAVLSKVFPTRSHTVAAQGGVGASLGNMGEDNWLWHMYDTDQGLRLARRPGCDRVHVPHGARGGDRARALRHAVRPQRQRHDLPAPVRRPLGRISARSRCSARCCAADRTGHAMLHTLYQRNVLAQHPVLRRVDGARPHPRRRRQRARRDRARDGNRRDRRSSTPRRRSSPPAARGASISSSHQRLHQHRRRPGHGGARRHSAGGHGVLAVPPDRRGRAPACSSPRACAARAATCSTRTASASWSAMRRP